MSLVPETLLVTLRRAMFSSIESPIALEKEKSIIVALQNDALLLLLLLGQKGSTCGVFEDLTDTFIGLC